MPITLQQLEHWLDAKEDERLEFKEAKSNFHFEKLVKYCAALANEGGGSIILGVHDKRPRKIVGSQAFTDIERTKAGLVTKLHLRIEVDEVAHPDGRILVFTAPARPIGVPIAVDGAYYMRAGEELACMTPDMLRRIFEETAPDFSAKICSGAVFADLDPNAIEQLRVRWHANTKNPVLLQLSAKQLLRDAELVTDAGVTYAALILLGTHKALGRHLAQAETVFEYRSSEAAGPANQREEFRLGFLLYYDRLWELVNLRNDQQHYVDRFVNYQIPTFREVSVREAILNSCAHRDFREAGSIFIRQYRRRIEIVSPGGFPQGVDASNILDKQAPRNRRIADTFLRCGLVERAGQGANRMLCEAARDGKSLPDYSSSDPHEVFLRLQGKVEDEAFVKMVNHRLAEELVNTFSSRHYLALDHVRRASPIPAACRKEFEFLRSAGIVKVKGRGRGTRYFFNHSLYDVFAQGAVRDEVPDLAVAKATLLKYVAARATTGVKLNELLEQFRGLSRTQVQVLIRELQAEGHITYVGTTKAARWFPVDKKQFQAS